MGTVEGFFKQYLGLPILLVCWAAGYIWKRGGWISLADIDIDTGRREHDWDAIRAYRQKTAAFPMWKRVLYSAFK